MFEWCPLPGLKRSWAGFADPFFWSRPNKHQRLHRLLGRKITVGTVCGKKTGRLTDVSRDNIVLRKKRRKTVVLVEGICWFSPLKPRKKWRKCC
jgi:hypothetical protein